MLGLLDERYAIRPFQALPAPLTNSGRCLSDPMLAPIVGEQAEPRPAQPRLRGLTEAPAECGIRTSEPWLFQCRPAYQGQAAGGESNWKPASRSAGMPGEWRQWSRAVKLEGRGLKPPVDEDHGGRRFG